MERADGATWDGGIANEPGASVARHARESIRSRGSRARYGGAYGWETDRRKYDAAHAGRPVRGHLSSRRDLRAARGTRGPSIRRTIAGAGDVGGVWPDGGNAGQVQSASLARDPAIGDCGRGCA